MSTKLSISETQKQALFDFVEKLLESSDDAETLREEFSELLSSQFKFKKASTKEKVKKDPAKPKRGKSGYIFFCSVTRAQTKINNPDMGGKDIMAKLGQLWSESSEEEKKPFFEQAKSDKDRYESEMIDYHPSDDDRSVSKSEKIKPNAKKEKVKKDPVKPKRAMTGYVFFCFENRSTYRDENPEATFPQLSKILGDAWKACDDKEDYKERAIAHFEENKALPMDGNWEE